MKRLIPLSLSSLLQPPPYPAIGEKQWFNVSCELPPDIISTVNRLRTLISCSIGHRGALAIPHEAQDLLLDLKDMGERCRDYKPLHMGKVTPVRYDTATGKTSKVLPKLVKRGSGEGAVEEDDEDLKLTQLRLGESVTHSYGW